MPLGLNLLLVPGEHVLRRHVADRAVQANVVVMIHIALSGAVHLPATAAFPAECIRLSATCAIVRAFRWRELSTTPQRNLKGQRFRVIHPHHPWYGREFELLTHKQTWGEDRVYFHDERERLVALPAAWTDLLPPDPFIVVANGRSAFRAEDLRELVQLLRKVSA